MFARARGVSDGRVKAKPRSFRTAAGPQIQVTEHGLEGATLHYRKSLFYSGRRLHILVNAAPGVSPAELQKHLRKKLSDVTTWEYSGRTEFWKQKGKTDDSFELIAANSVGIRNGWDGFAWK